MPWRPPVMMLVTSLGLGGLVWLLFWMNGDDYRVAWVATLVAVVAGAIQAGRWFWRQRRPDVPGRDLRLVLIGAACMVLVAAPVVVALLVTHTGKDTGAVLVYPSISAAPDPTGTPPSQTSTASPSTSAPTRMVSPTASEPAASTTAGPTLDPTGPGPTQTADSPSPPSASATSTIVWSASVTLTPETVLDLDTGAVESSTHGHPPRGPRDVIVFA